MDEVMRSRMVEYDTTPLYRDNLNRDIDSILYDDETLTIKLRDKLKACRSSSEVSSSSLTGEDSSYDSDYDGNEEQQQNHQCQQQHGHEDVNNAISDNLGQEFNKYETTAPIIPDTNLYQSKVEFALKLGYTKKQVQAALQKLGPNPEQNELLAELIKLGAPQHSCLKIRNESEGCDNVDELYEQNCAIDAERNKLRPIVIDGSNVAMSHGNKDVFSCRGIKICVDWFRTRGHSEITVFVPKWRKETPRSDNPVIDQEILYELERERLLVFTPSREVGGKRMVCYDDRYILKLAAKNEGIVVSNDNYRDLIQECPEFRKVVEERILMFSFVNDRFMPPDDPLGRSGPTLDNFLKMPAFRKGENCPYGKKCTYGNKCKYSHPERGVGPQKSITEKLVENAQKQLLTRHIDSSTSKKLRGKSISLPLQSTTAANVDEASSSAINLSNIYRKQPLSRAKSTSLNTKNDLVESKSPSSTTASSLHVPPPHSCQPTSHSYYHMLYPPPAMSMAQNKMLYCSPPTPDPSTNLHRKLQRQLSINPTCDPRIYQMQRQLGAAALPDQSHHMPASRHYSYQQPQPQPDCKYLDPQRHSNVTRIASAPSTATPLYSMIAGEYIPVSCSSPQLNVTNTSSTTTAVPTYTSVLSCPSPLWQLHPPPATSASPNFVVMSPNFEESRRKLHYHLTHIFPQEQVEAAMLYYPNETNPQKICAVILSMFATKS